MQYSKFKIQNEGALKVGGAILNLELVFLNSAALRGGR
jgi:hypothetical protein